VGSKGDIGAVGPQGVAGPVGPAGPKGDAGAAGPQGLQGVKGDVGPQAPRDSPAHKGRKATGATALSGSREALVRPDRRRSTASPRRGLLPSAGTGATPLMPQRRWAPVLYRLASALTAALSGPPNRAVTRWTNFASTVSW
jgi:hypothetical protein